jgi:BolA protein
LRAAVWKGRDMSDKVAGGGRADRMAAVLREAFSPVLLEVVDDSARHAGHAGAAAGGETHYTIRIVSERFAGLKRLDRSRAVHHSLGGEFARGLHALSLELRSPSELSSKNS